MFAKDAIIYISNVENLCSWAFDVKKQKCFSLDIPVITYGGYFYSSHDLVRAGVQCQCKVFIVLYCTMYIVIHRIYVRCNKNLWYHFNISIEYIGLRMTQRTQTQQVEDIWELWTGFFLEADFKVYKVWHFATMLWWFPSDFAWSLSSWKRSWIWWVKWYTGWYRKVNLG